MKYDMNILIEYKNKGKGSLVFGLCVYFVSIVICTIIISGIINKLILIGMMVLFGIPVYMFLAVSTWDILLYENTIVFKNKFSITKNEYSFSLKDIKKVVFYPNARYGAQISIYTSYKKETFQTVGRENTFNVAMKLKDKQIPVTEVVNLFKRIDH